MANTEIAKERASKLLKKQGNTVQIVTKQVSKTPTKQLLGPEDIVALANRKQSISSVCHIDQPNPANRPTVRVENTYQLGPEQRFPVRKIETIAKDVIESYLAEERYEPQFCKAMSKTISEVVRNRIKELRIKRYKVVAIIQIGEQGDHGFTATSRCLWDPSIDSFACYEFKNGSLFAVATIFVQQNNSDKSESIPSTARATKGEIKCDQLKPVSLVNRGLNCYLNSALQGLTSSCNFYEDIKDLSKNSSKKIEKLELLLNLILVLTGKTEKNSEISKNYIFKNWNKQGQQDSFELLSYILNEVYNDVRRHMENLQEIEKGIDKWLKVRMPMRIILQYQLNCPCKMNQELPFQSDLALHVGIPFERDSTLSLQGLVNDYFDDEEIVGFECKCGSFKVTRQIRLIQPLPRTLCIHLQRTFWNGQQMAKNNTKVKIVSDLKIESKFCKSQNVSTNDSDETYKLNSVIVHHGNVNNGHYICYKRLNDKWFLTNDSQINQVRFEDVSHNVPYILFFDKTENFNTNL